MSERPAASWVETARVFLVLGATAFGGPAAHVALMHEELVRRRGWLGEQQFLDLVGASNLIPGPTSTELAIHVGYTRHRYLGTLVAGLAFLLPSVLSSGLLGWLYVSHGTLPWLVAGLTGLKVVTVAVVGAALASLAPKAWPDTTHRVIGLGAALASLAGAHELLVLLGAGGLALAWRGLGPRASTLAVTPALLLLSASPPSPAPPLLTLFWVFTRIGGLLYGSGYVLLAFLRGELVERWGWITEAQLFDAIAVGQATPGPLFGTATFLGWVLAGPPGALAATAGIFWPAFGWVALTAPLLGRLRRSVHLSGLLGGVNAAAIALMGVVTAQLARGVLAGPFEVALLLVAAFGLWRRLPATALLGVGAGATLLRSLLA